ncbi:MFS transporter, partial [Streptomyces sp. NRRL WC-3742]|uniref:MFS transporter n=1 Tax=Streptomyces sp. NRRL WC-3742 TaxID=1463934 RepID=UPI0004CBC436
MEHWRALAVLGAAQFLMVLDTAVMNVSISQLVKDFHTEVTAIQAVITLYALVMAAFMITGGKIGDKLGRRRAFGIGLTVYGVGSVVTASAPVLWVLALGWSVIEGLGAAMVLPALAALVAGSYQGRDRAVAYGVIGGLSGVGIAVGPLLGGWVTTYLTWRLVFAGEAVVVVIILLLLRWIDASPATGDRVRLDAVGSALSAAGLALVVLGVLQSSSWGLVHPRKSPFTVFGFSATLFVIAAGAVLLGLFTAWERRKEARGGDPLVRLGLLRLPTLRSGLAMLLTQSTILLGLFFVVPLYLQVVQGFNAFQTGVRLLPVSITMLLAALGGSALTRVASPRRLVRVGLVVMLVAIVWLLAGIKPKVDNLSFALAMGVLGLGMGLLASQLGNVVQSSVGESERSEAGGLQNTAQQLGSSLGTALIGAILISALAGAFNKQIAGNPQISDAVRQQVGIAVEAGVQFVPTAQVQTGLANAAVPPDQAQQLLNAYSAAQLDGLKIAILTTGGITLAGFAFTRHLPAQRLVTKT